jgi:hypothetical protein
MTTPRIAPLEGDRISPAGPLLPDFLTDASKTFFITPRWRVRVLVECPCGVYTSTLVKTHEWISAPDAAAAVEAVRAYGYTDAVRYETELVEEVPR